MAVRAGVPRIAPQNDNSSWLFRLSRVPAKWAAAEARRPL